MAITLDGGNVNTVGLVNARTAQSSTSGTAIDFTSVPAGVKRITVMLNGVSSTGSANLLVQLGTSGGVQSSGYAGGISTGNNAIVTSNMSTGFDVASVNATSVVQSVVTLVNVTGNTWMMQGIAQHSNTTAYSFSAGAVTLSAALTTVRVTSVGGTNTFDAGQVNILYE